MRVLTKCWIALGFLSVLSPVGLLLPARFKAGSAWGEWGADEMAKRVGYMPQGLKRLSEVWNAPMPDYALSGGTGRGLAHLSFAYVLSALFGLAVIALAVWVLSKFLVKKSE